MMLSLLLASALALTANAQERDLESVEPAPAPSEQTAPVPSAIETALTVADDLARQGDDDAAREVLGWVLDQDPGQEVRMRVALQLAKLPTQESLRRDHGPAVRLVAWQATLGAYLLGPNLMINEPLGYDERAYLATGLLGGGLGAGGALLMAKHYGIDSARSSTIMAGQQLMTFNGAVLGYALSQDSSTSLVPAGMLLGAGGGTALGTLWALQDPDPAGALALQWGTYWGVGLGFAVMGYTYAFDDLDEGSVYPLALAANLGALGGWTLARGLGASRQDVRMFNAGALVGGLGSYGFAWITSNIVWYTEHGVVAFVTGATIAGGVAGVALNRWMATAPADRRFGRRKLAALSLPTPTLVPYEGRALPGVTLTEVRF